MTYIIILLYRCDAAAEKNKAQWRRRRRHDNNI